MKVVKKYDYAVRTIADRAHLNDPEFLAILNEMGDQGYKRSEEKERGSNLLDILFEREILLEPEEELKLIEKEKD